MLNIIMVVSLTFSFAHPIGGRLFDYPIVCVLVYYEEVVSASLTQQSRYQLSTDSDI